MSLVPVEAGPTRTCSQAHREDAEASLAGLLTLVTALALRTSEMAWSSTKHINITAPPCSLQEAKCRWQTSNVGRRA